MSFNSISVLLQEEKEDPLQLAEPAYPKVCFQSWMYDSFIGYQQINVLKMYV